MAYIHNAEIRSPSALSLATLLVCEINSAGPSVASFEVGSSRLLSYRVELTYPFKFNVQHTVNVCEEDTRLASVSSYKTNPVLLTRISI